MMVEAYFQLGWAIFLGVATILLDRRRHQRVAAVKIHKK
jgi:hypothetical protein